MNNDAVNVPLEDGQGWEFELARFAERLRPLIPEGHVRGFARDAGIDDKSLRSYMEGKTAPGIAAVVAIARVAKVRLEWLVTGNGPASLALSAQEESANYGDAVDFMMVPRYDVDAGAGDGKVVERESEIGRLAFRKDWIKQKGLSAKDLVVIRISGDSMEPTVRDGSLVLVDSSQNKVVQDGIYVLMLESHLVAKRLQVDFAGGLYIRSDNPAYREQHLTPEQAEGVTIVGRVVWAGVEL